MSSLFFQISSIFYIGLITIIYFSKKSINTLENKIYIALVCVSSITLVVDMASVYYALINPTHIFANILCKLYLISILAWVFLFTYYIFVISSKNNNGHTELCKNSKLEYFNKVFYITIMLYIIASVIVFLMPLYIFSDGKIMYTYGPSAMISYAFSGLCLVFWLVIMISNFKKIRDKKYLPAFAFIILAAISIAIQSSFPEVLLVTSVAAFITVLTYFTIENPDMKMIEKLNLARDQADKANRAKTDFLSSMSHEIRTPLNAIVGFSDCIENADTLVEAKENAKDVISASGTLLEIVNGILDISKIEAGKLEIINTDYDARELLNSIGRLIKARLGDKPLDFTIRIAPDIPQTLYGDHSNLKKIIVNLLTNAIKYTNTGFVEFKIDCIKTDDVCRLIISVEDSGKGIKTEDIDKLFTKFQRLEEDRNTTLEGTGLGLAITKQLIELMNGKIVVQSIYGKGSKFTVAIDQKIKYTVIEPVEKPQEVNLHLANSRILIVDDNKLNLKVANKLISVYEPTIELVESGFECINNIKNGIKYDLILMDDMMPKLSGPETLKQLKQLENFNIPVIALTANAITGMKEKYLEMGFNDYLAKPIEKEELVRILGTYIKKQVEKKEELKPAFENYLSKKVLVVDDNNLNIKIAINFLKPYNLNVESVLSGDECIDKINNNEKYDLIFMDDMMPKINGVETFKTLEKIENFNTPVVALTANALDGMREKYLNDGFNDYLAKPIDKKELDRILKKLL